MANKSKPLKELKSQLSRLQDEYQDQNIILNGLQEERDVFMARIWYLEQYILITQGQQEMDRVRKDTEQQLGKIVKLYIDPNALELSKKWGNDQTDKKKTVSKY